MNRSSVSVPRCPGLLVALCLVLAAKPAAAAETSVRQTPAQRLEQQLEQLQQRGPPGSLQPTGGTIRNPSAIRDFYRSRNFSPVWTGDGVQGLRGRSLLNAIDEGARHGLNPRWYHLAAIEAALAAADWSTAELLMSDAFLLQARHRADGALDPRAVAPEWYAVQPMTDVSSALEHVSQGADPGLELFRLLPREPAYWRLLEAKPALRKLADRGRHLLIPPGPVLRPGMSDSRVPLLRQRLALPAPDGTLYDLGLADAVADYQKTMGLEPDGLAGPRTLETLNRTPEQRLQQIDANLERWRWLPARLPANHILVNVPAFRLNAVRDGDSELTLSVIVGKPLRPTPAFWQDLQYLVFNPYWEVPETIAVEDKLPELRRDPSRLAGQGMEAARWGSDQMVPVDQIDWRRVSTSPFPYRLRQLPGPYNPLGRIKFMLPNEQAIYLHDTPDQALFERCERDFSSGCVRVANAQRLAEWVLQFQEEIWDGARIETQITSGETRNLTLDTPIAVFIVYFTSYVDADGTLQFYRDLYDGDSSIINALNAPAP